MTTPLLELLDRACERSANPIRPELHLAVRDVWAPLFRHDSRFASLLPIRRQSDHAGVPGLWRLGREMKAGRFDAVILGPPSLRAGLSAALAGIPCRIGHVGDLRGWLLRPGVARGPRGRRHFSREMLELGLIMLDELGLPTIPLENDQLPCSSLPGCQCVPALPGTADQRPLWVVAPGTTYGQAKTWPDEKVGEFLRLAVAEAGVRVALLGDRQAAEFVAPLRQSSTLAWSDAVDRPGQVVDLTGRTDLEQVVGVLKTATGFVGNDSGLMHLAGALGVPTVGIFGSSNPAWTHPLGPSTTAVVAEGFSCRPCYRKSCNQALFCLETVSAAAVLERLQELLAGSESSGRRE